MKNRCADPQCQNDVTYKTQNQPSSRDGLRLPGMATMARDGREQSMREQSMREQSMRDPFGRMPSGKVDSRFCQRHTCSYFFRAETCLLMKHETDSVCNRHAQCDVPECPKGKIQYLNQTSPDDEDIPVWHRLDFCADHKCASVTCTYIRAIAPGPGDRPTFQEHCEYHGCQVPGCKKLRCDGLVCCQDHKCKFGNCMLMVDDKAFLCRGHVKCEQKNCDNPKQLFPGSKLHKQYCAQHVNCDAQNCNTKRQEDSNFCIRHTCVERSCEESSGNHLYCTTHRCQFPDCEHPRAWFDRRNRFGYCALHMCRVDKCNQPIEGDMLFCGEHGCKLPNCKSEGVVDGKCGEHMKLQIEKEAKAKAKAAEEALKRKLAETEVQIRELHFDQRVRSYNESIRQASAARENLAPLAPGDPRAPVNPPYNPRMPGPPPPPDPGDGWRPPPKGDGPPGGGIIRL